MEEVQLVIATREGSRKAFVKLVELYETRLFRTAIGILGSRDDALDVVQDTFWQALKSISGLTNPELFRGWLTKILINKCMDVIRKKKHVVCWETLEESSGSIPDQELSMDMAEALGRLDEKYRLILTLRYFQDLSTREISAVLDCPEGTVKSRLHFALEKLRQELGYHKGGE